MNDLIKANIAKRIATVDAQAKDKQARANALILEEGLLGISLGTRARVDEIISTVFGAQWEVSIRGGISAPPEVVARRFTGKIGDGRWPDDCVHAVLFPTRDESQDPPVKGAAWFRGGQFVRDATEAEIEAFRP